MDVQPSTCPQLPTFNIQLTTPNYLLLLRQQAVLSLFILYEERKVRATKSILLPNGKDPVILKLAKVILSL